MVFPYPVFLFVPSASLLIINKIFIQIAFKKIATLYLPTAFTFSHWTIIAPGG